MLVANTGRGIADGSEVQYQGIISDACLYWGFTRSQVSGKVVGWETSYLSREACQIETRNGPLPTCDSHGINFAKSG